MKIKVNVSEYRAVGFKQDGAVIEIGDLVTTTSKRPLMEELKEKHDLEAVALHCLNKSTKTYEVEDGEFFKIAKEVEGSEEE